MKTKKFLHTLVLSPSFSRVPQLLTELHDVSEKVTSQTTQVVLNEDQIIELVKSLKPDGLIVGTESISQKVIHQLTSVKSIGKYGVGLDNIHLEGLKTAGIHFGWQAGVNKRSVSELVLGFMLGHQRNIFRSLDAMQQGNWNKNGGFQLTGKTLGIVGFGFIGQDLAQLVEPFGLRILAYDIDQEKVTVFNESQRQPVTSVTYPQLLESSDIISFHVPGDKTTYHMYAAGEIASTKPGALIINTSRGHVIDFKAATEAVLAKKLSGFAADVFPEEPFLVTNSVEDQDALLVKNGFYFTPHIGGNALEATLAMGRAAIKGLLDGA